MKRLIIIALILAVAAFILGQLPEQVWNDFRGLALGLIVGTVGGMYIGTKAERNVKADRAARQAWIKAEV
ncbi:MAG: hypothetical protein IPL32_18345 [Chloracidobacterium sp.]|nr:hypothetical protein [Chloracidobacterium sp.]